MSRYLEIMFSGCDAIGISVRQGYGKYADTKYVYMTRGSCSIKFPLERINEFIEFLKQTKAMEDGDQ
jgi:hypothetical protein